MPLYEYECRACHHAVTIRARFDDESVPRCPDCGGEALTRLISQISVARSGRDRVRDLSWIDHDVSRRLRSHVDGPLTPGFRSTLDRLESG
jgi:putative FmdB family regulatory protein